MKSCFPKKTQTYFTHGRDPKHTDIILSDIRVAKNRFGTTSKMLREGDRDD